MELLPSASSCAHVRACAKAPELESPVPELHHRIQPSSALNCPSSPSSLVLMDQSQTSIAIQARPLSSRAVLGSHPLRWTSPAPRRVQPWRTAVVQGSRHGRQAAAFLRVMSTLPRRCTCPTGLEESCVRSFVHVASDLH